MTVRLKNFMLCVILIASFLLILLPKSASAAISRLEYVRRQLIASGLNVSAVNKIVYDRRLKLLPISKGTAKPIDWSMIESKLLSDTLVQEGRSFIASHASDFTETEKAYGVKKEVLAGIIAIETEFGKNTGGYGIFNIFYSNMRRQSASRWKGSAAQLIALTKYCIQTKVDCYSLRGSYAGAIGLVQFMPNSILAYGVDGNTDGKVDLFDPADALPSAANFLVNHGWTQDQLAALTHYYGSSIGYPGIVLKYASKLSLNF